MATTTTDEVTFMTILTPAGAGPKGTNFRLAYEGERYERVFAGDGGAWVWARLIETAQQKLGKTPTEAVVTITLR